MDQFYQLILEHFFLSVKGSKDMYNIFLEKSNTRPTCEDKWSLRLKKILIGKRCIICLSSPQKALNFIGSSTE